MYSYLITGGAGYIGSHIVEKLINKKKSVIVYDNLSTGYKFLVNKKAKFIKGDINNFSKLSKILVKYNVKTIFHFAASINVAEAEINKKKYFTNNILGTRNLIKAIKQSKINLEKLIFSSSCTVYGGNKKSVKESSKIKPEGYYGYTKATSENDIISFSKKLGYKYGILRFFNVVGASKSGLVGESNSRNGHLFKNLAIQSQKKKKIIFINGKNFKTKDGTCVRDYIHIIDLVDIHLKTLNYLKYNFRSIILNCGYGKGYSVLEIANEAKKIIKDLKIKFSKSRIGDVNSAYCNVKKLKKLFKWKPKYNNIKIMLKSALNWEKKIYKLKKNSFRKM